MDMWRFFWHSPPTANLEERERRAGPTPVRRRSHRPGGTMRRGKVCWLGTAVLLGLGVPAAAQAQDSAGTPAPAPGSMSVFNQYFGLHGKPKPPPPNANRKPAPKPAEDWLTKARAEEWANLLRRQEVCQRLMEVAAEKHDDALLARAQELDRRAYEAYSKRMAELGGDATGAQELLQNRPATKPAANTRSAGLLPFLRGGSDQKERAQ
jgi:hypothetical protein